MACTIVIDGITGFRSGSNPPHRIEVTGSADGCDQVCVTFEDSQSGLQTPEVAAGVSNGAWTAVFTVDDGHFALGDTTCGIDKKIIALAHCCEDPTCQADPLALDVLECRGEDAPCPTIAIAVPNAGDCNADGSRTVSISATVTVADAVAPAVGQWTFDGGDGPTVVLSAGSQSVTITHDYPGDGSSHTVGFNVVLPEGCQDGLRSFNVPACNAIQNCPQVGTPTAVIAGDCNADGTRTVTLNATVTQGGGNGVFMQWSHDGAFGAAVAVTGQQQVQTTHNYPGDGLEHEATLGVVSPQGCAGSSVVFRVPDCPVQPICPTVSFTDPEVASECDSDGLRHVKVTAVVAPGSNGNIAATLELLDEGAVMSTLDSGAVTGRALTLEGETDLAPGDNYTARVTVASPLGCPGASTGIEVPSCDTPPPGGEAIEDPPTTSSFDICSVLRFLVVFGIGLAAIGLVLLLCPLIAAPLITVQYAVIIGGVLLGLGLLIAIGALIAWVLLCDPSQCGWMLLLWQTLFIAGVLLTYAAFCPACAWFGLGVIVLAAALAAFIAWVMRCRPTTCSIYAELLLVMIVFDITAVLEFVLGACVITSNPIAAVLWALGIAAFNVLVYTGLRRNNCIVTG